MSEVIRYSSFEEMKAAALQTNTTMSDAEIQENNYSKYLEIFNFRNSSQIVADTDIASQKSEH
ncbi:MAG: hypothetical protein ACRC3B_10380 [Bacteroidia bacterium]